MTVIAGADQVVTGPEQVKAESDRALSGRGRVREPERYTAYAYSYPHKTSYRPFPSPLRISELWEPEKKDALFLYIHIPFCEMRCGFCNLFTTTNPALGIEDEYLDALERQASQVKHSLGEASFARMAIGGGTPTYLEPAALERLFDIANGFNVDCHDVPTSVETSPLTSNRERLLVLKSRGVERLSIGVQSFIEAEVMAVGRSQKTHDVLSALDAIRAIGFPVLNLDLIYGLPGQTQSSFVDSIGMALQYRPEEIYLYPLYVRPLTGLARSGRSWDDQRLEIYRSGRDYLIESGYEQVSMRMFQLKERNRSRGPIYCCQNDGMIGLGCGARSYTTNVHYSTRYAVGKETVREILQDYIAAAPETFYYANHGIHLNVEEQKRRFIVQSLLLVEGFSIGSYQERFATDPVEEFSEMFARLGREGWIVNDGERIRLTETGLEWSDRIGYDFYSTEVLGRMIGNGLQ